MDFKMIHFKNILAATMLFLAVPSVNATLITENSSLSVGGETSFSYTFDVNDLFQNVSLFFDTEDLYSASWKHIELFLDGNLILDWGGSTYINRAPNIISLGSMKYKLYGDVAIDQFLWESISADNQVTVSWNQYSVGDYSGDYVAFELTGNISTVPEPSALTLMIGSLSLLAFLATRRRKLKSIDSTIK
jgi:hypothetical protein